MGSTGARKQVEEQRWRDAYENERCFFNIEVSGLNAWDSATAVNGDTKVMRVRNEGVRTMQGASCIRVTIRCLSSRRSSTVDGGYRSKEQYVLLEGGGVGCVVVGRPERLPPKDDVLRWRFVL